MKPGVGENLCLKTSVLLPHTPRSITDQETEAWREEEPAGPTGRQGWVGTGTRLGSGQPAPPGPLHPTKPPEEDVKLGEAERVLAGLCVRAACWAPATPPQPGDLMCLQAGSGAPAAPSLLPAPAAPWQPGLGRPPGHSPSRVRKPPGPLASVFALGPLGLGFRALNAGGRSVCGLCRAADRSKSWVLPVRSRASPCSPWASAFPFAKWVYWT